MAWYHGDKITTIRIIVVQLGQLRVELAESCTSSTQLESTDYTSIKLLNKRIVNIVCGSCNNKGRRYANQPKQKFSKKKKSGSYKN